MPKIWDHSCAAAAFLPKSTAKIAVFARFYCKSIYFKKALPGSRVRPINHLIAAYV
jgi:hypothetical protein